MRFWKDVSFTSGSPYILKCRHMWFQLASHCTSYKAWNATRAKVVACQADVSVFLSFLQSWSDTLSIQMQCLQNWALLFFITLCPLVLHYLGSGATLYLSYRSLWLEIFVYCPNCHRSKKEKKKENCVKSVFDNTNTHVCFNFA